MIAKQQQAHIYILRVEKSSKLKALTLLLLIAVQRKSEVEIFKAFCFITLRYVYAGKLLSS